MTQKELTSPRQQPNGKQLRHLEQFLCVTAARLAVTWHPPVTVAPAGAGLGVPASHTALGLRPPPLGIRRAWACATGKRANPNRLHVSACY